MLARLVGLAGKALATQSTATAPLVARAVESAVSTSAARRIARAFSTNSHDIFNTHKDTPENNANTVFEFTPVREGLMDLCNKFSCMGLHGPGIEMHQMVVHVYFNTEHVVNVELQTHRVKKLLWDHDACRPTLSVPRRSCRGTPPTTSSQQSSLCWTWSSSRTMGT